MSFTTNEASELKQYGFFRSLKKVLLIPLLFFISLSALHLLSSQISLLLNLPTKTQVKIAFFEPYIFWASLTIIGYWMIVRSLNEVFTSVSTTRLMNKDSSIKILLPLFSTVIRTILLLVFFNQIIQYANISRTFSDVLSKISSILIISGIAWITLKLIDSGRELLLHIQNAKGNNALAQRRIYTQTLILKRIANSVIIIIAIGCSLMLFENVRALGASVLTTAGIAGIAFTFMAQRSLGSLFAGLEIALTQPIRIGDSVIIDNEFGTIEEINFRNVVIKLWDWRRLIVPTNYFLEKSFQNWSRQQDNGLIGSIFLYVDFTLSVAKLRAKLHEILESSNLWDRKVANLQVTDLREQVMQIRILASAKNPDDSSNLQSEIREKIIAYIVTHSPESLPMSRSNNFTKKVSSI